MIVYVREVTPEGVVGMAKGITALFVLYGAAMLVWGLFFMEKPTYSFEERALQDRNGPTQCAGSTDWSWFRKTFGSIDAWCLDYNARMEERNSWTQTQACDRVRSNRWADERRMKEGWRSTYPADVDAEMRCGDGKPTDLDALMKRAKAAADRKRAEIAAEQMKAGR